MKNSTRPQTAEMAPGEAAPCRSVFRFNLSTHRSRVNKTGLDTHRGPPFGCSSKEVNLAGCVLNPDESKLGVDFRHGAEL